jgi:hypothetical protein
MYTNIRTIVRLADNTTEVYDIPVESSLSLYEQYKDSRRIAREHVVNQTKKEPILVLVRIK